MVQYETVRYGTLRYSMARCVNGTVLFNMEQYTGAVWNGMTWYSVERYATVQFDAVLYTGLRYNAVLWKTLACPDLQGEPEEEGEASPTVVHRTMCARTPQTCSSSGSGGQALPRRIPLDTPLTAAMPDDAGGVVKAGGGASATPGSSSRGCSGGRMLPLKAGTASPTPPSSGLSTGTPCSGLSAETPCSGLSTETPCSGLATESPCSGLILPSRTPYSGNSMVAALQHDEGGQPNRDLFSLRGEGPIEASSPCTPASNSSGGSKGRGGGGVRGPVGASSPCTPVSNGSGGSKGGEGSSLRGGPPSSPATRSDASPATAGCSSAGTRPGSATASSSARASSARSKGLGVFLDELGPRLVSSGQRLLSSLRLSGPGLTSAPATPDLGHFKSMAAAAAATAAASPPSPTSLPPPAASSLIPRAGAVGTPQSCSSSAATASTPGTAATGSTSQPQFLTSQERSPRSGGLERSPRSGASGAWGSLRRTSGVAKAQAGTHVKPRGSSATSEYTRCLSRAVCAYACSHACIGLQWW